MSPLVPTELSPDWIRILPLDVLTVVSDVFKVRGTPRPNDPKALPSAPGSPTYIFCYDSVSYV